MSLTVKGISGGGKLAAKLAELAESRDTRVRVGILEGASHVGGTKLKRDLRGEKTDKARKETIEKAKETGTAPAVLTALIGFVHEFGSEDGDIPPRSFMRSTVMQRQETWADGLKTLLRQGKSPEEALAMLGMQMAGDVKAQLVEIADPALKPENIARKGHEKPLIDTKQLINSIDSEVAPGKEE